MSRQTASGHHQLAHRLMRDTSAWRADCAAGGTTPVRAIVATNAVMLGPTQDSHTKNNGMITSRRACTATTDRSNRRSSTPSMSARAAITSHSAGPSISPINAVLVLPRTRPSRRPSRCNGPSNSESSAGACVSLVISSALSRHRFHTAGSRESSPAAIRARLHMTYGVTNTSPTSR